MLYKKIAQQIAKVWRASLCVCAGMSLAMTNSAANVVGSTEGTLRVEQGTMYYSIPIALPKGIAGMEPELSLDYSSMGGNGPLGMGWSLGGLTEIIRCPKTKWHDDVKEAVQYDSSDRYCMDGQRLVAISGEYGGDGTEYRTEMNGHSKIISHGQSGSGATAPKKTFPGMDPGTWDLGTGPLTFSVYTKAGHRIGYSARKHVYDESGQATEVQSWRVSRIRDTSGRGFDINFIYNEDSEGHLQRIEYANTTVDFHHESRPEQSIAYDQGYIFRGQQRLNRISIYDGEHLFREYRLDYQQGGVVGISQIRQISECFSSAEDNCLPPTQFGWLSGDVDDFSAKGVQGTSLYVNHLGSFSRIHYADFNGDSRVDIFRINSWMDKDRGYQSHPDTLFLSNGDGSFEPITTDISMYVGDTKDPDGTNVDLARIRIGDFNGDGNADIYRIEGGGDRRVDKVFLSSGDGTFDTRDGLNSYILWGNNGDAIIANMSRFLFADFNGDGRTDLYEIQDTSTRDVVHYANDDGTFSPGPGGEFGIKHQGEYLKVRVGDFNGDGMADVFKLRLSYSIYYSEPSAGGEMFLSQGQGKEFQTINVTMEGIKSWRSIFSGSTVNDYSRIKTGDFNGDGKTDFYRVGGSGSESPDEIYLSRGDGTFTPPYNGPNTYVDSAVIRASADISRIRLADFNGDGRTDVYRINGFHSADEDDLFLSVGEVGFTRVAGANIYVHDDDHPDNQKIDMARVTIADFSGDGRPDIYRINGDQNAATDTYWENQASPMLINRIENGLGATTDLTYKPLTDDEIYTKGREHYHSPVVAQHIQPAQFVVASRENDNGIGGTSRLSYQYEALRVLRNGREESLGFMKVISHNETAKRRLTLEKSRGNLHSTTFPFDRESVSSTEEFQNLEGVWQTVKRVVTERGFYRSFEYEADDVRIYEPRILSTTETLRSLDQPGTMLKRTVTVHGEDPLNPSVHSYDEFGNPLYIWTITRNFSAKSHFRKFTKNEYDNNATGWILGRLKASEVTHSVTFRDSYLPAVTRRSAFEYYSNGLLKEEIVEPGSDYEQKTVYEYDNFGNKVKTSVTGYIDVERTQLQTRDSYATYFPSGRFVQLTTNALGHTQNMTYHPRCGTLETSTDPNGLTTSWKYDGSCRKIEENRADGTWTRWDYQWADSSLSGLAHSVYSVTETASAQPPSTTYYDKLGRAIRQQSVGFDGRTVYTDTAYDALGRIYRVSLPYYADESNSIYWTTTQYDDHNRIENITKPALNGGTDVEFYDYDDYVTEFTNAKGQKKTTYVNAIGQTVRVEEELGAWIEYEYDAVGNLEKTIANDIVTTTEHDIVGNKRVMDDPNMGQWQYQYNGFGELIWQQDAKGQVVELEYDLLGRLIKRTEAEGITQWQYDTAPYGIGKLASVVSPGGYAEQHVYDELGRPIEVKTAADNQQFSVKTNYDEFSRVSLVTRPQDFKLENVYNEYGFLAAIRSPKSQIGAYDNAHLVALYERDADSLTELDAKVAEYEALVAHYRDTAKRYQGHVTYYSQASAELAAKAPELQQAAEQLEQLASKLETSAENHQAKSAVYSRAVKLNELRLKRSDVRNNPFRIRTYQRRINTQMRLATSEMNKVQQFLAQASAYRNTAHDTRVQLTNETYLSQTYLAYAKNSAAQATEYLAMASETSVQVKDVQRQAVQHVATHYQSMMEDEENIYFWRATERDAAGRLVTHLYGNGIETSYRYDGGTGWLTNIDSRLGSENLRQLEYDYDSLGNVSYRADHAQGMSETFNYDGLNRLDGATVSGFISGENYSNFVDYEYDVYGNLTYKSDVGHYRYGDVSRIEGNAGPHAVVEILEPDHYLNMYIYDLNGNLWMSGGPRYINWTSFNKPSGIETEYGNTQFAYNADRARYLKVAQSSQLEKTRTGWRHIQKNTRTLYLGKLYERETATTGDVKHTHFIYAENRLVATHVKQVSQPDETLYFHHDNLGSLDTVTASSGEIVERLGYEAFGQRRNGDWSTVGTESIEDYYKESLAKSTTRGYTGHEHLDNVNLVHMNGRLYDPFIGRFISADPFVQAPDNSQSYNRYSYVWNNPMTYTDPTGYFVDLVLRKHSEEYRQATGVAASILSFYFFTPVIAVGNSALNTALVGGSATDIVKSAALTGLSMGVSYGIGEWGYMSDPIRSSLAHGIAQGAISRMGGGSYHTGFWSGFLGHAAGEAMGDWIVSDRSAEAIIQRTAIAASVGGTASRLGGGKFANGARTMAFLHLFSEAARYYKDSVGRPANPLPGENRSGQTTYRPDPQSGQQFPQDKSMNVVGFNEPLTGDWVQDLGKQGSGISKVLNMVPTVNATAGLHDYWFNPGNSNRLAFTTFNNVGTMFLAAPISIAASIGNFTQGNESWIFTMYMTQSRYRD